MGCIYIAKDLSKPNRCKIGLTKGTAKKRISQTENPDYVLHYEFPAPDEQLVQLETTIHNHFERKYKRLKHKSSNRKSEWFECSPDEAFQVLCSGAIQGISPINSETGEYLNGFESSRTNQTNRDSSTGEHYVVQVVGRQGNSSCFVKMVSVSNQDTLKRLVAIQNSIQSNPDNLSSFSVVFDASSFGSTLVKAELEVLGRLGSKFVRERDESGRANNVFLSTPSKVYQYLMSGQFKPVKELASTPRTPTQNSHGVYKPKSKPKKTRTQQGASPVVFAMGFLALVIIMVFMNT